MAAFSAAPTRVIPPAIRPVACPVLSFRRRNDFCSFYLIVKYQLVLMMHGLEYALNTNQPPGPCSLKRV
jgi:hypothetical protein